MKLKYDPTVTTGHIITAVAFLLPAIVYGVTFWNRFQRVEDTVVRHERMFERMQAIDDKLAENQQRVALTLQHISDLLDAHIKQPPPSTKP